jgi:hypothetical protein
MVTVISLLERESLASILRLTKLACSDLAKSLASLAITLSSELIKTIVLLAGLELL